MKLSIFTPTFGGSEFLLDLYNSIKDQQFDEWVIVPNNGGKVAPEILQDGRVKVYELPFAPEYVGAVKKYVCSKCSGDILVEVDHDDILTPDAIEEVRKAFEDSEVGFVYSNSANFKGDFEPTEIYSSLHGWVYRPFEYKGHKLYEAKAFKEYPSGISKIWYCPNHIRAWRKSVYDLAGGHPENMRILDDQDLISRTYPLTKFKHIDKCLYLYRVTGTNTWIKYNQEIQDNVIRVHNKYITQIAESWADRNNLLKLDMGGVHNSRPGYKTCDIYGDVDFKFDASKRWPFEDASVGVIRAFDFMEHIADKIHLINEMYRVLAHGGMLISETPSTEGRGAFQDPTHVAYYNEHSFWYYTDHNLQKYCPQITAKFQVDTLETYLARPYIYYVRAYLTAIKGKDLPGEYGFNREDFSA